MNYKTEQQCEFQCTIQTFDKQLQIYESAQSTAKLDEEKIRYFQKKIKDLNAIFDRMHEKMKSNMRNKNYNQYDLKNKLKKYIQAFQRIKDRCKKLEEKVVSIQKNNLMANRNINDIDIGDLEMQKNCHNVAQNINKQANSMAMMANDAQQELYIHGKKLGEIMDDTNDFQHELTLSDQLMRVIVNRDLMTKLILILLIFFLGLADILILIIKLLGK